MNKERVYIVMKNNTEKKTIEPIKAFYSKSEAIKYSKKRDIETDVKFIHWTSDAIVLEGIKQ